MAHSIYISNVSSITRDVNITRFFGRVTDGLTGVELQFDAAGNYLRSARVSFASELSLQQALTLSGTELDGKPAILSVIEPNGDVTSLYVHVSRLAPQAKHRNVFQHFNAVATVQPVVTILKLGQNNNNLGFALVFLKSLADYRSAVALHNSVICCRQINVAAGRFAAP